MTQEYKDLLLKDLCARFPYGVFVKEEEPSSSEESIIYTYDYHPHITQCKPYLRPMSSMTKEERKVYIEISSHLCGEIAAKTMIDWLISHGFDYLGLIPKNLAIEVTEENNPLNNKDI